MRCLTLADALRARGGEAHFVCAEIPDGLADRVRGQGHRLSHIGPIAGQAPAGDAWDTMVHEQGAQRADAARTSQAIGEAGTNWIVVDHYQLDRIWEEAARPAAGAIMVIDDLANRPHACDLLLDQTLGRRPADYAALVPDRCRILAGAMYAPLRPEFAAMRSAALTRRAEPKPVERLLITLGGTDVGGVTERVLCDVLATGLGCDIDVVLGTAAPSLPSVQALTVSHTNIRLHVDHRDMAALMLEADLAIGAAGTTSWERCCLGLPALTLVLATNQRFIAEQLEAAGAHRVSPTLGGESFRAALSAIVRDDNARTQMSERAAAVTDGRGAERVCEAMLGFDGQEA